MPLYFVKVTSRFRLNAGQVFSLTLSNGKSVRNSPSWKA
jgi:hypothetical protein